MEHLINAIGVYLSPTGVLIFALGIVSLVWALVILVIKLILR